MMNFHVARLQTAYFFKLIDLSDRTSIAQKLRLINPGFIKSDPIIVPIDQDAPPEIPALIFEDRSTDFSVQVSRIRFDTMLTPSSPNKWSSYAEPTNLIQDYSLSAWDILSKDFSAKADRIGFIATLIVPIDSPIEFIRNKYIMDRSSEKSFSIHYNYLNKVKHGDLKINYWVKIVGNTPPDYTFPHIVLEFDVNTIQQETIAVRPSIVRKFFANANKMIESSIQEILQEKE